MKMQYLEVSVVARKLNVSAATVYRMIQKKKLKAVNHGASKAIRVTDKSLIEFMKIVEE